MAPRSFAETKRHETIAAIVNDDAITHSDMERRMRLIIVGSRLPDTPDTRKKMAGQVLSSLIDESIRQQEAKRLNIKINENDIKAGFAQLAQQNKMKPEQFIQALQSSGVDPRTMFNQIKAQLSWNGVIQKHLRPQVNISERDIKAVVDRLKESAGKIEYHLAEIYLPFAEASEEPNVRQLANQLVLQMTDAKKPSSFPLIARQFSQAATAANGGDKGWVIEDTLPSEHLAALKEIAAGQFTKPVRTEDGYTILAMLQQREVTAAVTQDDAIVSVVELTVKGDDAEDDAMRYSEEIKGCLTIREIVSKNPDALSIKTMENRRLGSLPKNALKSVKSLDIGQISMPVETYGDTYALYMMCSKDTPKQQGPNEEDIVKRLGTERLNSLQRRYFRDLKATAFIEKRL